MERLRSDDDDDISFSLHTTKRLRPDDADVATLEWLPDNDYKKYLYVTLLRHWHSAHVLYALNKYYPFQTFYIVTDEEFETQRSATASLAC